MSFRYDEVERLRCYDLFAMLIVKCPILPIDVNVPTCLHMLIGVHGAALPLLGELLALMGGKRLVQRVPTARVLLHKLAAGQPYLLSLRFLLNFRYMRALVRHFAGHTCGDCCRSLVKIWASCAPLETATYAMRLLSRSLA